MRSGITKDQLSDAPQVDARFRELRRKTYDELTPEEKDLLSKQLLVSMGYISPDAPSRDSGSLGEAEVSPETGTGGEAPRSGSRKRK